MEMVKTLAQELKVHVKQIETVIAMFDQGDTVPFIARYRKEQTQGLTDTQLRHIEERLVQLRELIQRRDSILASLKTAGQLTEELKAQLLNASTKARLEDLYLPFRPKRQSKALLAKQAGLEPLADQLLSDTNTDPKILAESWINTEHQILNVDQALDGAGAIWMERISESADLIQVLREKIWLLGKVHASAKPNKKADAQKYKDYFDYQEAIKKIPAHRALALLRGRREDVLALSLVVSADDETSILNIIQAKYQTTQPNLSAWMLDTVKQAWKTRIKPKLESEALATLKELADEESIRVFTRNLRSLLLAAPAGQKVIMGLDPGIRTGIKIAIIDRVGRVLDYSVVYPFAPELAREEAIKELVKLVLKHGVELISIGNGTASRETEQLVAEMMRRYPDVPCARVIVSEAGASVYSASERASEEFPDLDVTIRGAVSIARRLQDPLAELVKIDPKAIGVGQYQHDVNQAKLARSLEGVVEDCVNAVGVDVNTASVDLLSRVAGLNEAVARQIVQHREELGPFTERTELMNVARLGPKTFEQSAGFLRIKNGSYALDATGIHPESYDLVETILKHLNLEISNLMGQPEVLKTINVEQYSTKDHGKETLQDILKELEKPGFDPRPVFKMAQFAPGIETMNDLRLGMELEGVISNVTNFGAFVDVGVHQDGLVHISELASKFIKDPCALLKTGEVVKVKVIELDMQRKRIGLSMKALTRDDQAPAPTSQSTNHGASKKPPSKTMANLRDKIQKPKNPSPPKSKASFKPMNTAMADALAKWKSPT